MMRLLLTISLLVACIVCKSENHAKNGILDLRKADFNTTSIKLDGEWQFFWNQLLAPGQITKPGTIVNFPSLWNDLEIDTKKLSGTGFATYRLQIILPSEVKNYTLHVEDMYSSFSLFFNGELVLKNGTVATSREKYVPEWKPDFVEFKNLKDTNEVVIQIANFDHYKGGSSESISIGYLSHMKTIQNQIIAFDLILTGSFAMGGLFFLGLYFFGHHDKAIFYFSMFCIVYSYRIIGFGYYELHHLIQIPWYLAIRLEYISLFACTFLFGKFIEKLYPGEIRMIFFNIIYAITLSFSVATLVFPVNIFTHLVTPFFIILILYLVIAIIIYVKAFKKNLIGSEYALLSTVIVFIVFVYNILVYFNILPLWMAATFWGYVLFFFSQSLILSFRFAYFLKAEKEKAELASLAKTDFLSTISHEIRTPLNAVVGISHLLLQENPREDQFENITSLKFSAEHLTALIDDILDYNKLESGVIEFEKMDVNLCQLGQRIHQFYLAKAMEKGLDLQYECDPIISGSLVLDATRTRQVLNNLLDNAIKFTTEGVVKLAFTLVSEDEIGQEIQFEIIDRGIGIPNEKLEIIFDRFTQASSSTTREYGGSGLGLSIVKKILEFQGVHIEVSSQLGEGTIFHFIQKFPFGSEVILPTDNAESETASRFDGKKILLVEDNKMNILVAGKFLKRWGLTYEVAENGKIAVDKTLLTHYDLILMDLQMPEMDGYQATEAIRMTDKDVPIIALSASSMIEIREKALHSGMNDFITKPFDPKELRKKILSNIRS
ncbi:MAG: signal transduction histidine kinase/CheY-like chemotaxis protein [Cyclobacteriaceae bacterium]|jgi:signal transduction histidine kinase/CheY-like chemotaxis protein